jgi:photosystem II stability/assembly factor-like uncharacterized protein
MKRLFFLLIPLLALTYNSSFYSQNLWQPVGNLSGKIIYKLLFDYSGKFFALTSEVPGYSNEIYCSTDGGNSWDLFSNYFQNYNIQRITFNRHNIPFVIANVGGLKMFYSADEGKSWLQIDTNFAFTDRSNLVTNKDFRMYANGQFSIFSSTDDGITWMQINRPGLSGQIEGIAVDSTGNLYSPVLTYPTNDYIHRSSDNGASWTYLFASTIQAFGCNTSGLLLLSGIISSSGF